MEYSICKDFMFKKCKREKCKFNHIENVCFYFWKNGSCKFGNECTKSHDYKYLTDPAKYTDNKIDNKTIKKNKDKYNKKKVKNTECFVPMDKDLVDLRVVLDLRNSNNKNDDLPLLTSRDLLLSPNLFSDFSEFEIYNRLVLEIQNCGISENELLKMWHGNNKIDGTHLIADDHLNWKEHCPTFNMIIQRLKNSFKMDIKATRFNWYRDPKHWKPFHHDSAAINPQKAKNQNFTVAISFGATRDAALEHAKTKTVISSPQPDSTIYAFSKDTNVIWRHGILQESKIQDLGRISIIVWGWVDNIKEIS
jgi:hypothetical protein